MQAPMTRVCYALMLPLGASVYLFGWRSLALVLFVVVAGMLTEAAFVLPAGRPVTSSVFVTALIFSLSLPPTLPFWMALVGIVVAVGAGKMMFGGFGKNVFNPAMVGRCFIYVTFPIQMTGVWVTPLTGAGSGLTAWSVQADAVTRATPLAALKAGAGPPVRDLVLGGIPGSLGETSALLILLGAAYLFWKKTAPWRLALSCLAGALMATVGLRWAGVPDVLSIPAMLFSGSFLFGAIFVVTEPVSGPNTRPGQWIYGGAIGALTVALRVGSNFPEGLMFAVLLGNAFVPILDRAVRRVTDAGRKGG